MNEDLQIHNIAEVLQNSDFQEMHASDAEGVDLLNLGKLGAGLVRFPALSGVKEHTHIGAHALYVLQGTGELSYEDERHPLVLGNLYGIPSKISHAIYAQTELVLLVIGDEYQSADSPNRLKGGGSILNSSKK